MTRRRAEQFPNLRGQGAIARPFDAAFLRQRLHYDPDTGKWTWLVRASQSTFAGDPAGWHIVTGYMYIRIKKKAYGAHRLAYLYMMGEWPLQQIDHANGDPSDCRWSNLRPSDQSQNMANARRPSHNTSGHKGVNWSKQHKKWKVQIQVNSKKLHLGFYTDLEAAVAAYATGAEKLFGEFARTR